MKTSSIISSTVLSLTLVAGPAMAERSENQQAIISGGAFATGAIAGAVVGGPVGAFIGALGGAFLGSESQKANKAEMAINQQIEEKASMEQIIESQEYQITRLQEETVQKLTFQVLFATGEDKLNEVDMKRVKVLATYLAENPSLNVNLNGHTDPRGTDEYNNVLSSERALAVKHALESLGVESNRIISRGHGSSFSTAPKGDLEAYAQERRVDIQLDTENEEVAQSTF